MGVPLLRRSRRGRRGGRGRRHRNSGRGGNRADPDPGRGGNRARPNRSGGPRRNSGNRSRRRRGTGRSDGGGRRRRGRGGNRTGGNPGGGGPGGARAGAGGRSRGGGPATDRSPSPTARGIRRPSLIPEGQRLPQAPGAPSMSDTASAPTSPEYVELTCDVCDEQITGPSHGAGSAKFKLASHRYRLHGVRKDGTIRAPKGKADEGTARPIMGVVRDVRNELAGGKGSPSEDQLANAMGRTLGLLTTAVASYAVDTDADLPEEEQDKVIAYLSLSQKAAKDTVRPLAHLAAPSKLNKRFGRVVVDNVDAAGSVLEIGELVLHWRFYFKDRARRNPKPIEATARQIPSPMPSDPPHAPGGTATPAEQVVTSGAPMQGVVVSAEMLQTQRAQRGRP